MSGMCHQQETGSGREENKVTGFNACFMALMSTMSAPGPFCGDKVLTEPGLGYSRPSLTFGFLTYRGSQCMTVHQAGGQSVALRTNTFKNKPLPALSSKVTPQQISTSDYLFQHCFTRGFH